MTAAEKAIPLPCDQVLERVDQVVQRAISIAAPVAVVFRWLCQLKVAPYSYDLLDNVGRRSPRELTPGVEHLEVGQRVMTLFELVDFAVDDHLTVRTKRLGTQFAVTYAVRPDGNRTRLMVRTVATYPRGPVGAALKATFPGGDLVMMRKQLRTLKRLAETSVGGVVPGSAHAD